MTTKSTIDANVRWAGDLTFIGYAGSEHGVVIDGGKSSGGLGIGASPMELLLMGAGGCACIDIILILEKARQKVTDCRVAVSGKRADDHPRIFTEIHMHFSVTGRALAAKQVERAIELSMTKYCSASQTLAKAAKLSYAHEIHEDEDKA